MSEKDEFVDYYKIIQCDRNASIEEIKQSYQRLLLLYHPDKRNGKNDLFLNLQKAWSVLKDSQDRKRYDAQLSCYEHSDLLIYDKVSLEDMEYIPKDGVYTYSCRCGGTYVLSLSSSMSSKVIIGCDECSFSIEINL